MSTTFRGASRAVFAGAGVKIIGIPVTALLSLWNTYLIIAHTGTNVYGLVNTIAMLGALLPFADLGMGAIVTTAVAIAVSDSSMIPEAVATINAAIVRLGTIMFIGLGLICLASATGFWAIMLGQPFSVENSWLIGCAMAAFFIGVPLGLGTRCLVGLDLNHVAVALAMLAPVGSLAVTMSLVVLHIHGMPYILSGYTGAVLANLITCFVSFRVLERNYIHISWSGLRERRSRRATNALLAGSLWMFVVMIGLPIGLETGRIILSHLSTPAELTRFAIASQIYSMGWSVISTSGTALWSIFARQRNDYSGSLQLWKSMLLLFGGVAALGGALMIWFGPWVGQLLTHGIGDRLINISRWQFCAFAFLLVFQALHLPAGVLLTQPNELRWQAKCVSFMAVTSITIALLTAVRFGGVGITTGAVCGVLFAQFIPDLFFVKVFLGRRN